MNEQTADQWAAALHSNLVQASLSLQHRCVRVINWLVSCYYLAGWREHSDSTPGGAEASLSVKECPIGVSLCIDTDFDI